MGFREDHIRRLEEEIAEYTIEVEELASGRLRYRRGPAEHPLKDVSADEIKMLGGSIRTLEGVLAHYRAFGQ
jgi:hypothetical protein